MTAGAAGRPVLLVTSDVPTDRVAPLRALQERRPFVVARFGGGTRRHAGARAHDPGVPVLDVPQRAVHALAASGRYAAVVAGTVGRTALPAAYLGAQRAGVPFVLWSALWSQPHVASLPLMLHLYRRADAVAAYGEHVAAYTRARGARNVHLAPQAVDPAFWSSRTVERDEAAPLRALYVGRVEEEKGVGVLVDAWRASGLAAEGAVLTVVGNGTLPGEAAGIDVRGPLPPEGVRDALGAAHVLVVPSIATRAFREPWGLVANEAMHQGLPVIATDAVGAAAGGLVRHERNGLVVPERDPQALAHALRRLADDPGLRHRLGTAAEHDVAAFTPDAWADGMAAAIASVAPAS